MLDTTREQMLAYLSAHHVGVLSTNGRQGAWATVVAYRSDGLAVECLLPRWADVAYHIEQDPRVLLIVPDSVACPSDLRWLEYAGAAEILVSPDWSQWRSFVSLRTSSFERFTASLDNLYFVVRLKPTRIDLIDASRGWGERETLEVV